MKVTVTLPVNDNSMFRKELAIAMLDCCHRIEQYYCDPKEGKLFYFSGLRNKNTPWEADVDWRIVPISDLFEENTDYRYKVEYEFLPDFREMALSYFRLLADDITEEEIEEFTESNEIPDWIHIEEIINYAETQKVEWAKQIEEFYCETEVEAIEFATRNIKDEITIELEQ